VYNDNVKDPRIVKWLGEVVGKEGEDFCRHDKWLCMMYPRLQLLKRLLALDGSIWISIDDNEVSTLRFLMDEIFGRSKFIACNVWQKRYSRENREAIGDSHEYVLVYANNPELFKIKRNCVELGEKQRKQYKNPNNDPKGPWQSISMTAQGYRPNQMYEIVAPNGKRHNPPEGRCWSLIESEYSKLREQNKIYFGKDGKGVPRKIRYLHEVTGLVPWTWWPHEETGHTDEAKREMRSFFDTQTAFDTPKPTRLIQRILQIASDKNSIILDSFAGSGTTAHAVLNLNKKDNGNRKFILIEMMDYAETITAERVRRVIDGYGEDTKAVPGTGGDFSYYTLGERIFDDEDNLNEALGIAKIRDYVARTEQLPGAEQGEHPAWLGEKDRMGYYFHYQPDQATFLNMDFLATLTRKNEAYLIYADVCLLDSDFMHRHCIRFKKIPRDISRF
jgi:adenine-specific DNA-methyltransferase